jgi:hypothetical protein
VGKGSAVASAIVGLLVAIVVVTTPIRYCAGWRDAILIDAAFCFGITMAELGEEQDIANILAGVAIALFAIWTIGFFFGPFTC